MHPAPEQLEAFALGRLSADEQAVVEQHITSCPECCQHLRAVPDDSLLGCLRAGRTPPVGGGETMMAHDSLTVGGVDALPELLNHPRYRLLRKLGAGGMGEVYHAVHKLMDREVALKVIHPSLTRNPKAVQRFLLEVKAAAKLQHPNIVTAHDAEQVGGIHMLVMEYVEGISLDRLVAKNGPLPVEQAAHFLRQAALGLQHAHDKGMVHRDIKPHNLMVTRKGLVKILDFGLARLAQAQAPVKTDGKRPLTTLGIILGTPDYISPEQVSDSHAVDIRADIYSLGCTLYFLLSGQPPFPDGTSLQKALAHVDSVPQPIRELRADLPAALVPILDQMMAKTPEDRYQTPSEVAQALAPFVKPGTAGAAVEAKKVVTEPIALPTTMDLPAPPRTSRTPAPVKTVETPRPRPRPRRRRNHRWMIVTAVSICAVVLTVLTGLAVRGLIRTRPRDSGSSPLVTTTETPTPAPPAPTPTPTPIPPAGVGTTTRPRVLVVVPARQYWNPDYAGVREVLDREGALVRVGATTSEAIDPAPGGGGKALTPEVTLSAARAGDFDAVIFVGSTVDPAIVEAGEAAQPLLREMQRQNKMIAGVCKGVGCLVKAEILEGKKAAAPPRMANIMRQMGVNVVDQAVVVDDNIITGSDDRTGSEVAQAVLAELRKRR
jgi:serine/threonine-protein kinase